MTDLFDNANNSETPVVPEGANPIELLVGDGKKFKTVEDLAKGKLESDAFITRLLDENKKYQEELATRTRLEDIVDRLGTSGTPPIVNPDPNKPDGNGDQGSRDAPVDIEKLVEQTLTRREQESRQRSNLENVKNTLVQAWGDTFANKLVQEAAAVGMTKEQINVLAATNPKAFYKLVGLTPQESKGPDLFTAPNSQVNTTGFVPQANNARNKAYYDKMRRESPSVYFSSKVQLQEYKDAMALGDKFFT